MGIFGYQTHNGLLLLWLPQSPDVSIIEAVLDHLDREQKKRPQDFSTALYGQKHLNSNVNEKEATVGLKKFTVAIEDESLLGCLVYWCSTVCINYFCF